MPIGVDDFAEVRKNYYLIDKTMFLRDFLKMHTEVTLFTRPRRFGKTLTLSMMRYFFDIEGAEAHRELFHGLAVENDADTMAQQGTRPVVFLTMKGWKGLTWEILQVRVRQQLGELFNENRFLWDDDLSDWERTRFQSVLDDTDSFAALSDALAFLLRLLKAHYRKKVVLLLDEYDVPIQSAWEHGYYKEAIDFFRAFLSAALKTNPALDFAVLTGVLRISKESIFSDLNNLKNDSVLRMQYPEAFGFTTTDVEKLAADLGRMDKLSEVRDWYDGYRFGGVDIYNPWSVLNYFDQGCDPDTYWVNTSGNAILGELLRHTDREHLEMLEGLLQGGTVQGNLREGVIYSDIQEDEDALYTMLCTTGYLTIDNMRRMGNVRIYTLRLPNREIQALFGTEILNRFPKTLSSSSLVCLMDSMLNGDTAQVQAGLSQYLEVLVSTFDAAKGKEAFYHGFVLGMTALLVPEYDIRSNRESGYGRYDIAVFPKKAGAAGIVLEFKTVESEDQLETDAQTALRQIKDRDYDAEFRAQGVKHVLHYGIAFCGKRVRVERA